MNVWIIRLVPSSGASPFYRGHVEGILCWTTCIDHADVYTDDTLPPGNWNVVNAEEAE
jgi:hypothetical protein